MTVIRMYEIRVSDLVIRSIATERPNAANARVLRHIGRRGISIWRFQHVTDVVHDADLKCLNIATLVQSDTVHLLRLHALENLS